MPGRLDAPVAAKTVESKQQSPRNRISAENASLPAFGEVTSGLTPWESESEYYIQEKRVPASS